MMKKTILLLVAALCGVLTAAAQDLIVKTDATKVEAKVTEITPDAVRYKRFSNPDGPTYVLPVADIDYIQYANGEKERFRAAETVPAVPLTPATPVAAAPAAQAPVQQAAPVQYVAKEYQIGEFYDQNGVKGVVCMLTEDIPAVERIPEARPAGCGRRRPDRRHGKYGEGSRLYRRKQPCVG